MGEVRKENKMGTMSEGRLLLNMSLPMMLSMIVQAMYNVVDSIFVSRISENALTAVSLAFPLRVRRRRAMALPWPSCIYVPDIYVPLGVSCRRRRALWTRRSPPRALPP